MSFRLFIYHCTLVGAASALVGWMIGRAFVHGDEMLVQGLKGLWLGLCLALGLSLVDALWNSGRLFGIIGRAITAVAAGSLAGLVGALLGEVLYRLLYWGVFLVAGYTLVGLLIGLSIGVFDLLASVLTRRDPRGAVRKIRSGFIGGTLGGVAGGALSLVVRSAWEGLFQDKDSALLWSPSAAAFAALGACIGLFISLAQVILKEAWVKVEEGFRAGRERLLDRDEITLGRAESCDVGLFGDSAVERLHARIVREGNTFVLHDAGSATGTYLNDERVTGPRMLCRGDRIRIGQYVLRFSERRAH
jgi:hypothetical protein